MPRFLWLLVATSFAVGLVAEIPNARAQQETEAVQGADPAACSAGPEKLITIPGTQPGRIALIVTNQAYPKEVGALAATHEDGRIVCASLVELGFRVLHVKDANLETFDRQVSQYVRDLYAAGSDAVGFFYFAGHGAVADSHGDNYLIPTGAKISKSVELRSKGLKLGEVIDKIYAFSREGNAKANFVVIDACRNVAFPLPTRGGRGLSPILEQGGLLIAYSTAPNQTAVDAHHYSTALAEELKVADRPAYLAFREVRRRVLKATSNRQFPWMRDGLIAQFYFNDTGTKPVYAKADGEADVVVGRDGNLVFRDASCADCPPMKVLDPRHMGERTPDKKEQILPDPFAISLYEVTFADWARCVADGGCRGLEPSNAGWGGEERPVINVSWLDAQLYIEWLNRRTGKTFRLPTEAEWEFAAGVASGKAYGATNKAGQLCNYANGGNFNRLFSIPCNDEQHWGTRKVGSYKHNDFGLYDMAGNVWEWVDGCWDKSRSAVTAAEKCKRVLKGGSWKSGPVALKPTSRKKASANYASYTIGFRVARSIP